MSRIKSKRWHDGARTSAESSRLQQKKRRSLGAKKENMAGITTERNTETAEDRSNNHKSKAAA